MNRVWKEWFTAQRLARVGKVDCSPITRRSSGVKRRRSTGYIGPWYGGEMTGAQYCFLGSWGDCGDGRSRRLGLLRGPP